MRSLINNLSRLRRSSTNGGSLSNAVPPAFSRKANPRFSTHFRKYNPTTLFSPVKHKTFERTIFHTLFHCFVYIFSAEPLPPPPGSAAALQAAAEAAETAAKLAADSAAASSSSAAPKAASAPAPKSKSAARAGVHYVFSLSLLFPCFFAFYILVHCGSTLSFLPSTFLMTHCCNH